MQRQQRTDPLVIESTSSAREPLPDSGHRAARRALSARAVLLGFVLAIINTYWITVIEVRWYTLDGTSLPLFITPIFLLFLLCIANLAAHRALPERARRFCLSPAELTTIYVILVVCTLLAGHDLLQNLFGTIAHPYRFATPENHWKDLFFPFLPGFWIVHDPVALKAYYLGGVNPNSYRYWGPFVRPLLWWAFFLGTLIIACLCINVLIRTQWSRDERLEFPIIQLPTAMTSSRETGGPPGARLFRSKVMWAGFLTAAAIDLFNGLHILHPSMPYLPWIKLYDVGSFLTTPPWNAIGATNISMYPFGIGLAFFVPLDLSFSCWFFFLGRKLFEVFGAATGLQGPANSGFPYFSQQASGAWIAWGLTIAWALRSHLRRVWKEAFDRRETCDGVIRARYPQSRLYRTAFYGLGACAASLTFFTWKMGLAAWVSILFFGLYFLIALTITRARAELGTPHEIYFVNPRSILVTLFGSQAIGPRSLTALSTMYWFNRGYRNHPMPNQLEAMQLGENSGISQVALVGLLLLAFAWGILLAYWANLHVTLVVGGSAKAEGFKSWVGGESYSTLQSWLQTPVRTNATELGYMAAGFLLVLFLRVMRGSFLWWPFHPAGYALAVSYAMDYFWFCFFVAWLVKSIIVRVGGMRLYRAAMPFFMGLILGDYVVGSLWAIYGPAFHLETYKIYL